MQASYFVHHRDQHLGPFSFIEIEARVEKKELFPTDFVYVEDRGDWEQMHEFLALHGQQKSKTAPNYPPIPPEAFPATPKPPTRPTLLSRKIDTSARVTIEVLPATATRIDIHITGAARVGEELEILILACCDNGSVDPQYTGVVYVTCDRPLQGLEPVRLTAGTGHLRVKCLSHGTHHFAVGLDAPELASLAIA
jgi:hypothetical protein